MNTQGRVRKNIPLNLHQEHLNRLCKTSIESLGANRTDDAIIRSGKVLGTLHSSVLEQFDDDNLMSDVSGAPAYKRDLNSIVKELQQSNVFKDIPGRQHASFPKPTNVLLLKPAITHLPH